MANQKRKKCEVIFLLFVQKHKLLEIHRYTDRLENKLTGKLKDRQSQRDRKKQNTHIYIKEMMGRKMLTLTTAKRKSKAE